MSLRVRHLYRKAAIYGTLLSACLFFTIGLEILGVSWGTIALLFGAIALAGIAAYLLFDHVALWLLKAKLADTAREPRLYSIVERLIKYKGQTMPRLAMIDNPGADAFAGGKSRGHAIIFITSGLTNEFNDAELEAILAHELDVIDEMGSIVYNTVMGAFSFILKQIERPLFFNTTGQDRHDPPLVIDKAGTSDVPTVVKLLIAHGMYSYIYLHDLARLARQRSPLFLAAHYDRKPVGFIVGEAGHAKNVHILKIAIDGSYRQKGIGSRLMRAFMDMARDSGFDVCSIEVRTSNGNAISMYKKLEFQAKDVLPDFYPGGEGCLKMEKCLVRAN